MTDTTPMDTAAWDWHFGRRARCDCSASEYERHEADCASRLTRDEYERVHGTSPEGGEQRR